MKDFRGKSDSVMTDQGFLISDNLENISITINISAINGSEQLTKAERECQAVASIRMYFEKVIQLVKSRMKSH